MALKTYREALREALREEMLKDERVFVMGEDVGVYGGIFGVTAGFLEEFGEARVKDTPISEAAIAGVATGAAMTGMRPVAEIMFIDFTTIAMDQLVNQAAKWHYMSGGRIKVPMVLRTATGTGRRTAAQHSQSLEAWHAHVPGLKVVMPATPYDAKGLLKSAIRDNNPVVFIEHKMLYNEKGEVPEAEYLIPLGKADIKREGVDCTVVATSLMVKRALEAADILAGEGISIEVVDPRTIRPLDIETICTSVSKTHRLVIVHEASGFCGVGAEIATQVVEKAFFELDAPVTRVAGLEVPIPFSPILEDFVVPGTDAIVSAVRRLVRGE
ncbi:pyruvate/2-oxoglutarate dehydrogenase complex, dehydrogenase (E1) component, eukaryotic type, beta subunit [Moorella thermoacetica Y72]|uniref:Pyruvate/2-oxoglutarate dehydrogenase complex, dehydrogenase (E1) component, eukaryotic type, beta subunit n=1 Tax=Moorella thermoacetica Y72 TaxID=1325331 RepID=A0A0S6U977_NEOTH|nr:alpha-ketoacid dehydrogenase subunit beta [Moorella thermoacetica]GAF24991.1 pyruvate/2-oxoglutarate dehydrogenase complex, dehydrogenase (E1) component, eukaryotic type, beta subunit [Moorella thermoacetica Y72]